MTAQGVSAREQLANSLASAQLPQDRETLLKTLNDLLSSDDVPIEQFATIVEDLKTVKGQKSQPSSSSATTTTKNRSSKKDSGTVVPDGFNFDDSFSACGFDDPDFGDFSVHGGEDDDIIDEGLDFPDPFGPVITKKSKVLPSLLGEEKTDDKQQRKERSTSSRCRKEGSISKHRPESRRSTSSLPCGIVPELPSPTATKSSASSGVSPKDDSTRSKSRSNRSKSMSTMPTAHTSPTQEAGNVLYTIEMKYCEATGELVPMLKKISENPDGTLKAQCLEPAAPSTVTPPAAAETRKEKGPSQGHGRELDSSQSQRARSKVRRKKPGSSDDDDDACTVQTSRIRSRSSGLKKPGSSDDDDDACTVQTSRIRSRSSGLKKSSESVRERPKKCSSDDDLEDKDDEREKPSKKIYDDDATIATAARRARSKIRKAPASSEDDDDACTVRTSRRSSSSAMKTSSNHAMRKKSVTSDEDDETGLSEHARNRRSSVERKSHSQHQHLRKTEESGSKSKDEKMDDSDSPAGQLTGSLHTLLKNSQNHQRHVSSDDTATTASESQSCDKEAEAGTSSPSKRGSPRRKTLKKRVVTAEEVNSIMSSIEPGMLGNGKISIRLAKPKKKSSSGDEEESDGPSMAKRLGLKSLLNRNAKKEQHSTEDRSVKSDGLFARRADKAPKHDRPLGRAKSASRRGSCDGNDGEEYGETKSEEFAPSKVSKRSASSSRRPRPKDKESPESSKRKDDVALDFEGPDRHEKLVARPQQAPLMKRSYSWNSLNNALTVKEDEPKRASDDSSPRASQRWKMDLTPSKLRRASMEPSSFRLKAL